MYPHRIIIVPSKAYMLNPSYGDKFTLFSLSFSKSSAYMISHELSLSMRILDTYKLLIVIVIIKGNLFFGVQPTFLLLGNLRIGFLSSPSEVVYPSPSAISSKILLIAMPLDVFFGLGRRPVMDMLYRHSHSGLFPPNYCYPSFL